MRYCPILILIDYKKGRLKIRHIFSPSNNLIGKCELAEHPVYVYDNEHRAGVAQSVEQRIRNAKVGGSIPFSGTRLDKERSSENLVLGFQTTFFIAVFVQDWGLGRCLLEYQELHPFHMDKYFCYQENLYLYALAMILYHEGY